MIPNVVYKYMSDSVLNNGSYFDSPTLRFTPWKELNDIFELEPVWGIPDFDISEVIKLVGIHQCDPLDVQGRQVLIAALQKSMDKPFDVASYLELYDKHITHPAADFLNNFLVFLKGKATGQAEDKRHDAWLQFASSQDYGILSVSEKPDSILLWSYYCQHKGFVLGFNPSHSFFKNSFRKTNYQPDRPTVYPSTDKDETLKQTFLTKSQLWSHEKEWRFVQYRIANYSFNGIQGVFEVPMDAIHEVILGATVSAHCEFRATFFGKKNQIPIKKIVPHKCFFELKTISLV